MTELRASEHQGFVAASEDEAFMIAYCARDGRPLVRWYEPLSDCERDELSWAVLKGQPVYFELDGDELRLHLHSVLG